MLEKVRKTIDNNGLIDHGQAVLVGLSGGPDSVALLHILSRLAKRRRWRLAAVYINHGLRPQAARREEEFCQRFTDSLGLPFHIVRENIAELAQDTGRGVEETGRTFRYGVFEALADAEECDRIALGHQADDRVETILFHILRGTGRRGLIGMPVRRGRIVRPLFDCTKDEVLKYLRVHRLKYCSDNSNLDPKFTRNFLRNQLLPQIRTRINPQVNRSVLEMAETLATEESHLGRLVSRAIGKAVRTSPGGKIELDSRLLKGYDEWLRWRLLRHCVAKSSGSHSGPDRATTMRLDEWANGDKASISVPPKIQVIRTARSLVFHRRLAIAFCEELPVGKSCYLAPVAMTLRCRVTPGSLIDVRRQRRGRCVTLDWSRVLLPLQVRNIHLGDRFQPLGLDGSKKVADYLVDRKVDRVFRDEIPVVCDRNGIIWLVGYEIADHVKVDASTKEVLTVEFTQHRKRRNAAG